MASGLSIWTSGNFLDRFWAKVRRGADSECWPWLASGLKNGRGRIWIEGKMILAPRVAKIIADRRWPEPDKLACHSCDNPNCCNPAHIWWGTVQENTRDAADKGLLYKPQQRTHCRRGHELTPDNRLTGANRGCRKCASERQKAWREARQPDPAGDAPHD